MQAVVLHDPMIPASPIVQCVYTPPNSPGTQSGLSYQTQSLGPIQPATQSSSSSSSSQVIHPSTLLSNHPSHQPGTRSPLSPLSDNGDKEGVEDGPQSPSKKVRRVTGELREFITITSQMQDKVAQVLERNRELEHTRYVARKEERALQVQVDDLKKDNQQKTQLMEALEKTVEHQKVKITLLTAQYDRMKRDTQDSNMQVARAAERLVEMEAEMKRPPPVDRVIGHLLDIPTKDFIQLPLSSLVALQRKVVDAMTYFDTQVMPKCGVCYKPRCEVMLLPCNHLALCLPCFQGIDRSAAGKHCPFCRAVYSEHRVVANRVE